MSTTVDVRTRTRILDGAARAIARHGLTKLAMGDVSASAAVSRGTVYRYFPNREQLLRDLVQHEGRRFQERVARAIEAAPPGVERLRVALEHAAQHAREHPLLQRVIETDPAFLLHALRTQYPIVRALIGRLFGPLLGEAIPVREGAATAEQLVDWLTRLLISVFLFPDPNPNEMSRGLMAVYRLLAGDGRRPRARRGRARRK